MDALDNDDRVVHEHAGAEGQSGQGDDVQGVVPESHREQGDEEGDGYGGSDDDGRAEGPQKQDEHDDRERDADQRGVLQVGHRVLDQGGVVVHHRHLDPGQVEFQVLERGPDGARDLDRVRAGLLEHLQADALPAVHAHQVVDLRVGDLDFGDIGYPDRLAGLLARGAGLGSVPDDDALHVARIAEARDAADQEDLSPVLQGAGVDVDVLGHQPLLQLAQRDAERLHAVAVDPYAHLQLAPAQHPHFGDVGELLHGGRDLPASQAPEFGEIGAVRLGGQAEGHDRRLPRVQLADEDLVDLRVGRDRIDRLLDLDQGQVHVRFPVEADGRDQPAGAGDLLHLADAAHREQSLLDLLAVEPLHLRRRPVAGPHGDDDRRRAQVGEEVDRQFAPRHPAHEGACQRGDRDGYGPPGGESGRAGTSTGSHHGCPTS